MMLFKRIFTLILSLSLFSLSFGPAQAAMIANDQVINQAQQFTDRNILLQTIARADVQVQLASYGVNSADLNGRVNQMTPQEITQLNQRMAELPAGSGIVGLLLTLFIVFVVTDVIGATDIFPFIHPVN
jgi:hypothetical protein